MYNQIDNRHRIFALEKGVASLFLAFNRRATKDLIKGKALLLDESLQGLRDDKIEDFFRGLRDLEQMPSDGQIKKELRHRHKDFCQNRDSAALEAYNGPYARPEFRKQFTLACQHVIAGRTSVKDAWDKIEHLY